MVDWAKIKTIEDLANLPSDEIHDDSNELGKPSYTLMPGLTEEEIEDALFWKDYLRGIILVSGMPGQGKGMLIHMLSFKLKRYFGLTIISDTRPRPLFGWYAPFSEEFLVDQLDRQKEVADGKPITLYSYDMFSAIEESGDYNQTDKKIAGLIANNPLSVEYISHRLNINPKKVNDSLDKMRANDVVKVQTFRPYVTNDGRWMSSRGQVFLKRSVCLLDEFGSKYMNRREPHNPIHRTLLFKVFPIWRHLDTVIIGAATEKEDLDERCYPKLTTEIRCSRAVDMSNPDRLLFKVKIFPLRYISAMGEIEYTGKMVPMWLDGDAPRDMLGGKAWKDLYNSKQAIGVQAPDSMRRRYQ